VLESNGLVINDTLSLLIVKYFPYQIEKEKRKRWEYTLCFQPIAKQFLAKSFVLTRQHSSKILNKLLLQSLQKMN